VKAVREFLLPACQSPAEGYSQVTPLLWAFFDVGSPLGSLMLG
jgi:hypothetical protein